MILSSLLIPGLQVGFSLLNHVSGPLKTIEISHRLASTILDFVPQKAHPLERKDLSIELKLLQMFSFRPWIACLETACSFEQILALHGEPCEIQIGKYVENGRIFMHAWVETSSSSYFKSEHYERCFVQSAPGT